jgi:hypothetical protein
VAARAEVPALAGEGEQVFVGTGVTPDAREPVLEDAAGKELVRDLRDDGTPRAVLVRAKRSSYTACRRCTNRNNGDACGRRVL